MFYFTEPEAKGKKSFERRKVCWKRKKRKKDKDSQITFLSMTLFSFLSAICSSKAQ
jgi:hypothetical protein